MDAKNAFEAIDAIRDTVPAGELPELDLKFIALLNLAAKVAGTTAVAETLQPPTPEFTTLTPELLLGTFDTAYQTYSFLVGTVNARRAVAEGREDKRPEQLNFVHYDTPRAEVDALLANEAFIAELQTELDYFTVLPETDSPKPGFDIIIVPEGLTERDEQVIARAVQAKLNTRHSYYIRPYGYNDSRTLAVTGKGYRIVIAPRHYNIPKGTTVVQTNWMDTKNNQASSATGLQTATDAEALAQINNLLINGGLNDSNTCFNKSCFRRFDQIPFRDRVSGVCVNGGGKLRLDESGFDGAYSTRALLVPKA